MRPFRPEKVASAIREILSEAITRGLNDPRIAPLTTVTRVRMSSDLQVATVFISVHGPETTERRTLQALLHARGHLQRLVGRNVRLRHTPELRIQIDARVRGVRQTLDLIERNQAESAEEARPGDAPPDVDEAAPTHPVDESAP
ncbi:MAG: 30S ribosome-binding factor RbfA [Phycisphaerales bacterium]|nr:MAG: 30S ribosome-binding factor RbfA [Phycisphaerales bacterium]